MRIEDIPDEDLCRHIMINWSLEVNENDYKFNGNDKDIMEDFIVQVISKKLKWAGFNINIPDYLYMILSICSAGSPGLAQIFIKSILDNIELHGSSTDKLSKYLDGYTIQPIDYTRVFKTEPPCLSNPDIESQYIGLWDKQKASDGSNMCDTKEWWNTRVYHNLNTKYLYEYDRSLFFNKETGVLHIE